MRGTVSDWCGGLMNASRGVSSERTYTRIYALLSSTLLRKTGPKDGS